jgi:hypothetical protein
MRRGRPDGDIGLCAMTDKAVESLRIAEPERFWLTKMSSVHAPAAATPKIASDFTRDHSPYGPRACLRSVSLILGIPVSSPAQD